MKIRSLVAVFACSMSAVIGAAQTAPTAQSVEAQLKGPIVILRGMYEGRTLKFDAKGNLIGRAEQMPFSMSAVRLNKVRVDGSEVRIEAEREGLEFTYSKDGEQRWVREQGWGAEVRIEIAWDPAHPEELNSALAAVFSLGLDKELAEEVPGYWRPWLLHQLDPSVKVEATETSAINLLYDWEKPKSEDITPPRLDPSILTMPEEPLIAQQAGYNGVPILVFVVDTSGKPTEIRIVRPAGMGLDEEAVKVASRLRFKPAQYKGKPAAVLISFPMLFSRSLDWGSQFDRGPTTHPQ
jgi:TonB family protein